VIVAEEPNGRQYYKRAFNTQACEQLNAWLGGYESLLRRMTVDNFNWFLHTMFIYHTQTILDKQRYKTARKQQMEDEDDDNDDENIF
jgi:hypothetical protein